MKFIHGNYNQIHDSSFMHSEVMDTCFGNRFRIILCKTKSFVELYDNQRMNFDKDVLLFITSGTPFKYGAYGNNDFAHDWFEFSAEIEEVEYYGINHNFIIPLKDSRQTKQFSKKIKHILQEAYSHDSFSTDAVICYLKIFLISLERYIEENGKGHDNENNLIIVRDTKHPLYQKVSIIRNDDEIVTKTCEKNNISVSHFRKIYKEIFHRTLSKDILSRKIQIAQKYLIDDSNFSVSEVVYMLNYKNHETFFRQFKRMTGMTPIQYKKRFSKFKK